MAATVVDLGRKEFSEDLISATGSFLEQNEINSLSLNDRENLNQDSMGDILQAVCDKARNQKQFEMFGLILQEAGVSVKKNNANVKGVVAAIQGQTAKEVRAESISEINNLRQENEALSSEFLKVRVLITKLKDDSKLENFLSAWDKLIGNKKEEEVEQEGEKEEN